MAEVTRIFTIQVTEITDSFFLPSREYVEASLRNKFPSADQVLVEVKDFIREEADEGAEE